MHATLQRPSPGEAVAAGVPAPRTGEHDAGPPRRRAPAPGAWRPSGSDAPVLRRHRLTAEPLPDRTARQQWETAARLLLNAVVVAAVLAFAGLALGPRTGEYRTLTMLTGSMTPAFPTGSVVVVSPQPVEDLRAGQVITFHAPTPDRRVVTHRVVSVDRSGATPVVVTKGDANAAPDPWRAVLSDDVVWRARFAVPLLGDVIRLARQPAAQLVLTRALPAVLLGWLLVAVWRKDPEDPSRA